MKELLRELVAQALLDLKRDGYLPAGLEMPTYVIERARTPEHGDYAANVALTLARPVGRSPREIAEAVVAKLLKSQSVEKVEVAGPGFINFHLSQSCRLGTLRRILELGADYGREPAGSRDRVTIEFVSANPTGPLHVGHGRGAAYGATLANLLEAIGHTVQREYYVNDAGRQMDILATSVWLRYLELCGEPIRFPDNGYRGEYVYDVARGLRNTAGDSLRHPAREVMADLPADATDGGDKELHVDALTGRAKHLLGAGYRQAFDAGLDAILADIRADLAEFRVPFDEWFSEASLERDGHVERAIAMLEAAGHLYEREGARWFRATALGDDKDRVVVRENGAPTYFASDLGYLLSKFERGFDRALYVFGADHHGYVARLRAAARGLGLDPGRIDFELVQFAVLYRGGSKLQMSTRSGEFVTLRELREEVGTDAARFFYVMRGIDQHLDFDLDLAKSRSNENPVYYVQYAHARICAVFRQLSERGQGYNRAAADAARNRLVEPAETALLAALMRYPEVVESAADHRAPQLLATYLRELAAEFHGFYNALPILVDDEPLRQARLSICKATRQVLVNGLGLLGVEAPETM